MSNRSSNYGNYYNPWGPLGPLMEQWAAAVRMWADAWSAFLPGMRPSPSQDWPGAPGSAGGAAPPPVSVEVSSARPTEVAVHMKPGTEPGQLRADCFEEKWRSTVSIDYRAGRIHVLVTVTGDQPAGEYHGAIRAAGGSIVGDLNIVVRDPAKSSA